MCDSCGCGEKTFEAKVAEVIESIRPMLQNDGGDIELVGCDEDKTVRVRLQGGVERMLKQNISEVKEVVAVN